MRECGCCSIREMLYVVHCVLFILTFFNTDRGSYVQEVC